MRWTKLVLLLGAIGCGGGNKAEPDGGLIDAAIDAPPDAGTALQSCRADWCWMYPLPQGNALTAIFGFSSTDIWAIGNGTALLHYDGSSWTEHLPPAGHGGDLFALYGAAPDDVWAIGQTSYHWDGMTWSAVSAADAGGSGGGLAIGGAANDVWRWDTNNTYQWDGSTWTPRGVPSINGRPLGFWSSGGSIYTVSEGGGIAKRVATSWGVVDAGSHPANAASFVSPTAIVLAGDTGSVWFYDGNGWVSHATPQSTSWKSVAATSLTDVWVSNGFTAAHWNGTTWEHVGAAGVGGSVSGGLWRDSSGVPWLVTTSAEIRKWSGSSWTLETTGVPDLLDITGTADDDLWATTRYGVRHWNGSAWSDITLPAQPTQCTTRDITAFAANDVWIALACRPATGDDMAPRRLLHWDGMSWSTSTFGNESSITASGFNAIWGSAANDIYAVAPSVVLHYDGNSWSPVTNGPTGGTHVFGLGSNELYVANFAQLWHWNGAWSMKTAPRSIEGAWQNAANDIWLGGTSNGSFFDGSVFVDAPFKGSPLGSASEMWVRESGMLVRYQSGFAGTRSEVPAFFQLDDTWRSPSGNLYVISGGALLVHEP